MIILASGSPRRQELLRRVVPEFSVEPAQIDERALPVLAPRAYVQRLAMTKCATVAQRHPGATVIAADTMVAFNGQLLGKPQTAEAATAMLEQLSGQTHQVHTGMCVAWPDKTARQVVVTTEVTFWPLTSVEIADYVATGEPLDKAGAYGIQGQGALLVKAIKGDYYNVVGLPISTLARLLTAKQ
ncbi:Maf family protein [Lacticaseibacillus hegangensis]|uniref:dTTP/UTP pyrophosphatase n=1 Tax=Lacticaseibacillus hegangensis TaxID=2486010 RepID=A0ABW4CXP5_9LACO|nr:Maf family protein [Lacticaseibacillus hegangensis]